MFLCLLASLPPCCGGVKDKEYQARQRQPANPIAQTGLHGIRGPQGHIGDQHDRARFRSLDDQVDDATMSFSSDWSISSRMEKVAAERRAS